MSSVDDQADSVDKNKKILKLIIFILQFKTCVSGYVTIDLCQNKISKHSLQDLLLIFTVFVSFYIEINPIGWGEDLYVNCEVLFTNCIIFFFLDLQSFLSMSCLLKALRECNQCTLKQQIYNLHIQVPTYPFIILFYNCFVLC